MNLSKWIRQIHRWLAIGFTVAVISYIVASGQGQPPIWLGLMALVPLILLLLTGLYMFFLPYAVRWRSARSAGA